MEKVKHPELVACTEVLEVKDAATPNTHTSTRSVCCVFIKNFKVLCLRCTDILAKFKKKHKRFLLAIHGLAISQFQACTQI